MKRFFLLSVILFISVISVSAQDIITKRDGEQLRTKVTAVTQDFVKYVLFDDPGGVVYIIAKPDVFMIQYQNGHKEVFNSNVNKNQNSTQNTVKTVDQNMTQNSNLNYNPNYNRQSGRRNAYSDPAPMVYSRSIPIGLKPGVKYSYRKLQRMYAGKTYVEQPIDDCPPYLAGFCSFVMPGLGQMLCGEVVRGLMFFLAPVILFPVIYIPVIGTIFYLVSLPIISMWSILDAVNVSKVKCMYNQDLFRLNQMSFKPSIQTNYVENGLQNQAKLFSYKFNF